ncbi:hypothetical protein M011DRAFT_484692 [Sporormia fimetaria CBS 119925]|uniref:Uncharacterized protein n=1 Tax=Sporormia fimetaria CBS 119925 TaxID=1340428 RepID=A0A6A6VLE2_9PLEO|nr:hypothetical protein M011DRAFT_484692 [Sporormia fimetaria CBS 119925]
MSLFGPPLSSHLSKRSQDEESDSSASTESANKRLKLLGLSAPAHTSRPSPPLLHKSEARSSSPDSDIGPAPPPAGSPAKGSHVLCPPLPRLDALPVELIGLTQSYLNDEDFWQLRTTSRSLWVKSTIYFEDRRKKVPQSEFMRNVTQSLTQVVVHANTITPVNPLPPGHPHEMKAASSLASLVSRSRSPLLCPLIEELTILHDDDPRSLQGTAAHRQIGCGLVPQNEKSPETFHLWVEIFKNIKMYGTLKVVRISAAYETVLGAMATAGFDEPIVILHLKSGSFDNQSNEKICSSLAGAATLVRGVDLNISPTTFRHNTSAKLMESTNPKSGLVANLTTKRALSQLSHISELVVADVSQHFDFLKSCRLEACLANKVFPALQKLDLCRLYVASQSLISFVRNSPQIERLRLQCVTVFQGNWADVFECVANLRSLKELSLLYLRQKERPPNVPARRPPNTPVTFHGVMVVRTTDSAETKEALDQLATGREPATDAHGYLLLPYNKFRKFRPRIAR